MQKRRMKKGLLAAILVVIMIVAAVPMTAFAAGSTNVYIGGTALNDGENTIGGGTATLNKAEGTLILDGISTTNYVNIDSDSEFTIISKGNNSIGSEATRTNGSSMFSIDCPKLNIEIQEGSTFSLYSSNGNNIYLASGSLNISGPGKFVSDTTGGFPSICSNIDTSLNGNLTAEITSDQTGIYSEKGNISIESANVTIDAQGVGIFAQTYDADTDDYLPSSITLRNSTLDITAEGDAAIFCGSGGAIVDNTTLTTDVNDDPEYGGFSIYTEGNMLITGAKTVINANDGVGSSADDKITIEDGKITIVSSDTALLGWKGVTITGGTLDITVNTGSAILARSGLLSITGENTSIVATSNDPDVATIRNFNDGGLYLDAAITANNTADGGKPFEGVKKDKSTAITLGEGFDVFGAKIYTTENGHSYFIPEDGDETNPLTGKATLCKHVWGEPVWKWADDFSSATATFTCANDAGHVETVLASEDAITSKTTTEASCTEEGVLTYTATVSFNGKDYTNDNTAPIPASGHKLTKVPAKAATEKEDGNIAYWECSVCGKYFADAEGKEEIADKNSVIIKATGTTEPTKPTTPEDPSSPDAPKTGDNNIIALWISLMILAVVVVSGTIIYKKKAMNIK